MSSHTHPLRIGLLATLLVCPALAKVDLPQPRSFVEDQAGIIRDDVQRKLNHLLAALEQKTGAQVIVYTIQTLDGEPIEQFTLRHAEKWQLGQKGKDNGVLVLIALRDRKYRIEVGEGLEGALPDGLVGSIGRKYFRTYFRRGDYTTGIYRGTLALIERVAKEYNVDLPGLAAATAAGARHSGTARQRGTRSYSGRESVMGCCCSFAPLLLMIIILGGLRSSMGYHRRWAYGGSSSWLWWLLLGNMMGSGRRHHGGWSSGFGGFGGGSFGGGGFSSGGFGGGGFGGGGFGGFGGGGGGSFGGGGASGGW